MKQKNKQYVNFNIASHLLECMRKRWTAQKGFAISLVQHISSSTSKN